MQRKVENDQLGLGWKQMENNWHKYREKTIHIWLFKEQMFWFTLCRSNFRDSVCFWEGKEVPVAFLSVP